MKKALFSMVLGVVSIVATAQKPFRISTDFSEENIPPPPNYGNLNTWAAHPSKKDMADSIPRLSTVKDGQSIAKVDVFFIHPTIFTEQPKNQYQWNADINDTALNNRVDASTILNQATAFNGSCRVFAPRYRQAHYSVFTTSNQKNKEKGLNIAYEDVKNAFIHYLENENKGRPIVIASHSQGTVHAKRLLREFFDGKPLQKQLVEAYLIGIAVQATDFSYIRPSNDASQTGGFVTWNTFMKGFYPDYYNDGMSTAVCTNPLTWKIDETYAPRELNKGAVALHFKFVENAPVDAQVNKGILWINKPYIKGRAFLTTKIWHKADINLFWMNVRENVALRIDTFLNQKK